MENIADLAELLRIPLILVPYFYEAGEYRHMALCCQIIGPPLGWPGFAVVEPHLLSLFCAQYGKCAVTGQVFETLGDIHCHHKLPKNKGGRDNYQNLIIVRESVHILIHATSESTIAKYLSELSLNKRQLVKLNKLRKEAGNPPVSA